MSMMVVFSSLLASSHCIIPYRCVHPFYTVYHPFAPKGGLFICLFVYLHWIFVIFSEKVESTYDWVLLSDELDRIWNWFYIY